MKKIIVANLKMNLTNEQMIDYARIIRDKITNLVLVIICPSFPYLSYLKSDEYKLGAQNCFYLNEGSYTGEVSPLQLKTIGVEYVILGHSERRTYFKEDNELINKKITAVLKQNMRPILCVGESKEERDLRKMFMVIKKQLEEGLTDLDQDMLMDVIIAYEPLWAIGSGKTPTINEIKEMASFIKEFMASMYQISNIKVLYGGSIDKSNIKKIVNIDSLDGLLIGSSSIKAIDLLTMIDMVE